MLCRLSTLAQGVQAAHGFPIQVPLMPVSFRETGGQRDFVVVVTL
jgi:hypothetical protein